MLKRNIIAKILLSSFMVPSLMATTIPTYAEPGEDSTSSSSVATSNTIGLNDFLATRNLKANHPNVDTLILTGNDILYLCKVRDVLDENDYDEMEEEDQKALDRFKTLLARLCSTINRVNNVIIDLDNLEFKDDYDRSRYKCAQQTFSAGINANYLDNIFVTCRKNNINVMLPSLIINLEHDYHKGIVMNNVSKVLLSKALEAPVHLKNLYLFNRRHACNDPKKALQEIAPEIENILDENTKTINPFSL